MQLNYISQTSRQSVGDIIHLYEKLNLVNIKREIALKEFYILLKWNHHSSYLTFNQLRKLWIKLVKNTNLNTKNGMKSQVLRTSISIYLKKAEMAYKASFVFTRIASLYIGKKVLFHMGYNS